MTELKVGDRIKNNDPRMSGNRVLTVERIWIPTTGAWADGKAVTRDSIGHCHSISLARIHMDGKPRRSGFTLLKD